MPESGPMPYDNAFFDRLQQETFRSAATIVPLVIDWIHPRSVVDVGCGRGVWLSVFKQQGVETIVGMDGDYVDREQLLIPADCFSAADLSGPLRRCETFDLAVCLEVAEHLSWRSAPTLVASLASLAPLVLFSAAVPGQSGVNHINAQWPLYWVALFADHGWRCLDIVRPKIWRNKEIEFYYRQNMFLFASEAGLARCPHLLDEDAFSFDDLQLVHAGIFGQFQGVRGLLGHLPGAVRRAITSRFSLRRRNKS